MASLKSKTVAQLRKQLSANGLKTTGRKAVLIERLQEFLDSAAANNLTPSPSRSTRKRKSEEITPPQSPDHEGSPITRMEIEGEVDNSKTDDNSSSVNTPTHALLPPKKRAKLQALLDEYDLEVESRCDFLRREAEALAKSMMFKFRAQLTKLPIKIRKMPLAIFAEKYAGSVSSVMQEDVKKAQDELDEWVAATPRLTSRKQTAHVARTDAHPTRNSNRTQTARRNPRQTRTRNTRTARKTRPNKVKETPIRRSSRVESSDASADDEDSEPGTARAHRRNQRRVRGRARATVTANKENSQPELLAQMDQIATKLDAEDLTKFKDMQAQISAMLAQLE